MEQKVKFHCTCGTPLEAWTYETVHCQRCGRTMRAWIKTEEVYEEFEKWQQSKLAEKGKDDRPVD